MSKIGEQMRWDQIGRAPRISLSRLVLQVFFLLILASTTAARAQDVLPPPTIVVMKDANGMNFTLGTRQVEGPTISVGQPGAGGLSYTPLNSVVQSAWWQDGGQWQNQISGNGAGDTVVVLRGQSVRFSLSGSTYSPMDGTGASLTYDTGSSTYTFTGHNGEVALFDAVSSTSGVGALLRTIFYPNGEVMRFKWRFVSTCSPPTSHCFLGLLSVTNNYGYQIKVNYVSGTPGTLAYRQVASVMAINNAVDYCDPEANSCSLSGWPTLTYSYSCSGFPCSSSITQVIDGVSRTTTITGTSATIDDYSLYTATFTLPSGISSQFKVYACGGSISCDPYWREIVIGGNSWTYYVGPVDSVTSGISITSPTGGGHSVVWENDTGVPTAEQVYGSGISSMTTTYGHDSSNRITRVTLPEGNYSEYTYDARGNITQMQQVAKPMWGDATITTSASYPGSCSNPKSCNKPDYVTDANGNRTDYTYDSNGNLTSVTAPAVNGVRAVTTTGYSALYAWYKNSSSIIVQAPSPIDKVVSSTTCTAVPPAWGAVSWGYFNWTSSSTCTGTSREAITVYGYDNSGSSSHATNLALLSTTREAGDYATSGVISTTSGTYDNLGNVATSTDPNSNVTAFFYDNARRQVGVVSPNPGSGHFPATKTVYDADGRVAEVVQGYTTSQSSMSSFSAMIASASEYNTSGLKSAERGYIGGDHSSGSLTSITQYSYDAARRAECAAVRMDLSVGSLPGACTITTPSTYGTDQITKNSYDNANRLLTVESGYNSGASVTTVTNTYTLNSKVATVADANGNTSAYSYNGQDRLVKLQYPNATGGGTSTSDYETYTYDANGNMTDVRLRDNNHITSTYDALNRLSTKTASTATYYSYDLAGNLLYAHSGSAGGVGVDYAYDALGRQLLEAQYGRAVSSRYDAAGNRTCLMYPDGRYILYSYDALNRMTLVRQGNATNCSATSPTTLAQYTYDDLSREAGISSRPNSVVTTNNYNTTDTGWSTAMSGASSNGSFTMSYTPGGQLYGRTIAGSGYAYSAPAASKSYSSNGLNQYASVSSTGFTYDARGNLTSDGSRSFGYDLENKLTCVGSSCGTMALDYDAAGRLRQTTASSTVRQHLYDGGNLIEEYDGAGTLLRRYVPGQGTDETLVWYEGSDLSSPRWLHTDQQGNVIAVTNTSATATPYAYSPTGEPSGGFAGGGPAFRYTGQVQLAGVALYYYKARMYDPALGRFLQADPSGYAAGMNLYAYVENDPANGTDPSGLDDDIETVTSSVTGSFCSNFPYLCTAIFVLPKVLPGDMIVTLAQAATNSPTGTNGNACPAGPYITGSVGAGGTLAALAGLNLGASLNIDFPATLDPGKFIQGFQISMSGQAGGSIGGGLYGGGGIQYSLGISGPASTGTSHGYYGEADIGAVASYGGSVQVSTDRGLPTGASTSFGGKFGFGLGVYAGIGKFRSATAVLVGCHG